MILARINRKIGKAIDLRALDFGVPVSALYQTYHHAALSAASKVDYPIDNERAPLAISLNDKAQPIPSGKFRVGCQTL